MARQRPQVLSAIWEMLPFEGDEFPEEQSAEWLELLAIALRVVELGRALGAAPVSVTEVGLAGTPAGTWQELLDRLEGHPLLYDLEALCWEPWLLVDLRRFLQLLARKAGVIALWPGRVGDAVASFSEPGRRDHVRVELAGMSVLRPVPTRFPDEVPFEIERAPR